MERNRLCLPEGLIIEKSSKDVNPGATPERSSVKTRSTVIAWADEDTSTPGGDRLTPCNTGGAVSGFASSTKTMFVTPGATQDATSKETELPALSRSRTDEMRHDPGSA